MRQDEELQTRLYEDYWRPIEQAFGARYRTEFDKFVRDYLMLQLKPSKQFKADEIYQHFRTYFYGVEGSDPAEETLSELRRFGRYYVAFSLVQEENPALKVVFRRLRLLVEVAAPLLLKLYDCYSRSKTLLVKDFVTAVELLRKLCLPPLCLRHADPQSCPDFRVPSLSHQGRRTPAQLKGRTAQAGKEAALSIGRGIQRGPGDARCV